MNPVTWISGCRYRLIDLVRTHWGQASADNLTVVINGYTGTADELASLHREVARLSERLRQHEPPVQVCRERGMNWTGD